MPNHDSRLTTHDSRHIINGFSRQKNIERVLPVAGESGLNFPATCTTAAINRMFRPNFSFDDEKLFAFLFLKYKNRSSSSSIATKKKKKKRKQLFSLKNLSFFSKKLRHLYESIPPFCFLLRRSVSFLHRRAHAPWYVSL